MSSLENNLNSIVRRVGNREPSKNLAKPKDDVASTRRGSLSSRTAIKKVDSTETSSPRHIFHKGMGTKEIEVELFLLEDDPEVEVLTVKGKIAKVMRLSSQDVKAWYAAERVSSENHW